MKAAISGPIGTIVLIVVVLAAAVFGYVKYVKDPPKIAPEDMRKNMQAGQAKQMEAMQKARQQGGGGRPNAGPPGAGGQ